jgi:hypothetical protein
MEMSKTKGVSCHNKGTAVAEQDEKALGNVDAVVAVELS